MVCFPLPHLFFFLILLSEQFRLRPELQRIRTNQVQLRSICQIKDKRFLQSTSNSVSLHQDIWVLITVYAHQGMPHSRIYKYPDIKAIHSAFTGSAPRWSFTFNRDGKKSDCPVPIFFGLRPAPKIPPRCDGGIQ